MSQSYIEDAFLNKLRALPEYPHLSILDLSCGDGEVLQVLAQDGCSCVGTRYKQDDYIIKNNSPLHGVTVHDGVDLTKPLPFLDGSFDVVIMIEVIEHIEDHRSLFTEAGRIIKPGGLLLFSSPNIYRLHSRAQFFTTGTHKLIRRRVGWDLAPDELYAYHINPIDLPLTHTLLWQAGLQIEKLNFTKSKPRHIPWLLFYPLVYLAVSFETRFRAKETEQFNAGERDLRKWLKHPALLFSEQLFVQARKYK